MVDYLQADGQPIHTRSLTVDLRHAPGDAVVARGTVIDLRKRGLMPTPGGVQCAGIIHQMSLSLEIDPVSREIRRVEVDQPTVAFEASEETRGECCRDPAPRLLALAGERLDASLVRSLGRHFGGPRGCSHLLTLAQLMASALPPALDLEARHGDAPLRRAGERVFHRLLVLDGLERDAGRLAIQVQLTDAHTRPVALEGPPFSRIARQHEVQLRVDLALPELRITHAEATERARELEGFAATPFEHRNDEVAWLCGRPLFGGIAGEALRRLDDARAPLRDVLLNLAPGGIQCLAATMDRRLERAVAEHAAAGDAGAVGRRLRDESVGGQPDACYMWRRGGPLSGPTEA